MVFQRKFGKKSAKKSSFVRVGNMFKSDKEYLPENASFSYSTTTGGDYLGPVAELVAKAAEAGESLRFTLTKWNGQEHPVLSVSPAPAKKGSASKRISKAAEEDDMLDEGQDIN